MKFIHQQQCTMGTTYVVLDVNETIAQLHYKSMWSNEGNIEFMCEFNVSHRPCDAYTVLNMTKIILQQVYPPEDRQDPINVTYTLTEPYIWELFLFSNPIQTDDSLGFTSLRTFGSPTFNSHFCAVLALNPNIEQYDNDYIDVIEKVDKMKFMVIN